MPHHHGRMDHGSTPPHGQGGHGRGGEGSCQCGCHDRSTYYGMGPGGGRRHHAACQCGCHSQSPYGIDRGGGRGGPRHHAGCQCGCHDETRQSEGRSGGYGNGTFRRQFVSRDEQIGILLDYLEDLYAEAAGVEEYLEELGVDLSELEEDWDEEVGENSTTPQAGTEDPPAESYQV